MANQQQDKDKDNKNKDLSKPDPETLHTTDPQENMKGPVSSFIQGVKKEAEQNDSESREEADEKREQNM